MTAILLDFSQRRELTAQARIVSDVESAAKTLKLATIVAGAFARDLHVLYAHGINIARQTEDLDFGIAVRDWNAFAKLKRRLTEGGNFREVPGAQHRLRHKSDLPVDMVPFEGVETGNRQIDWPPGGEIRMDVFGFREALATAQRVLLPGSVGTRIVSLPALVLLKLVAWHDRHYRAPGKDAHDLMLVCSRYLDLGNRERLWDEFAAWTEEDDFDYAHAGARMLGIDMRRMLDRNGRDRIARILAEQCDTESPGLLPQEMHPHESDQARALLRKILEGLAED